MKEYSVQELKSALDAGKELQLIDIREPWEIEVCSIEGAQQIPMGEILTRADELKKEVPVVIQCRSGGRSANVVNALEMQLGLENLYNLNGGILAWADHIDTSLEKY
ncbi:MAG: rhodanese-related sulfurtransferase [Bacteroidia bacterium]|jgi:rhodanese-related sulfurtransferase